MSDTAEQATDPVQYRDSEGRRIYFRHVHMNNGQRVTFGFVRLDETPSPEGITGARNFRAALARYNPQHETRNYTKSWARDLVTRRLQKANGACFDMQIPEGNAETYVTRLLNESVTLKKLPRTFRAEKANDGNRFRDHTWNDERALVRV